MIGEPLSVLVIDDDEIDRERVRRSMRAMSPAPHTREVDTIADAEAALRSATIDCVILDYQLREGVCSEFLPRLQALAPHAAFIVMTGQGDEDVAVELMKAGASDYLSKDVDPERVRQAIRYAVSLRRAAEQAAAADSRRRQYAARQGRFVDRAPELVAARSLDDLAKHGVLLAVELFDARQACITLRDSERVIVDQCGAATEGVSLQSWATNTLESGGDFASETPLAVLSLRGRDGLQRGWIALHGGDNGLEPAHDHLLRQLAVLIAICADNLLLSAARERAIRARDDVMAVVTHDLRAPLNNVRLGTSLLRETTQSSAHSVLDRVERNVTHMAHLVDDLVDMVRLESGKLELNLERETAADLLHTAAALVADQARAQRIELVIQPCDRALTVSADRDRVLQVLANLLSNALKFTPADGRIELEAHEHDGRVRFGVSDTGCGIPASEASRIFVRFWQSDPKRRRGLGLGLHIAKGVIQAHGGDLWFESQEGSGSRFYFTLSKCAPRATQTGSSVDDTSVRNVRGQA